MQRTYVIPGPTFFSIPMKSLRILLLLVVFTVCVTAATAQKRVFQQNRELHRAYLNEKDNLPLKDFVKELVAAYKAGKIRGYYPNAPQAPLSYNEFLVKFKLARRISGGQDDFMYCDGGENYRYNTFQDPYQYTATSVDKDLEDELLYRFQAILDIVQDRVVNRTTGREELDIKLIRLVWANTDAALPEQNGVTFHWEDVLKLADIRLPNRRNDAAPYSIQQFFRERLFTSVLILDGSRYIMSLQDADRTVRRRGQFEANIWSY